MDTNQAGQPKTYFEQIPVTAVKGLVERPNVAGPVTCPRCHNAAGAILRAVTHVTHKKHYRCESCLHVWTSDPSSDSA